MNRTYSSAKYVWEIRLVQRTGGGHTELSVRGMCSFASGLARVRYIKRKKVKLIIISFSSTSLPIIRERPPCVPYITTT